MSTERDHLDAETVAAWIDGGLDRASLAAAEAHASNCERCQQLLATVVKTEDIPHLKAGAASATAWWKWWMAPIAATAAAVTLWMVVPRERLQHIASERPQPTSPAARDEAASPVGQATSEKFEEVKRKAEPPPAVQEKVQVEQAKPGTAASANMADTAARRDRQEAKSEERLARLEAEPARAPVAPVAPAAPSAPAARVAPGAPGAPAEAVQLRKQFAPLVFVSPDPRFRWRVSANGIERSEDSGRSWFIVRLPQGEAITAGASPAPLVCWLVGRRGLVLVANDGTNFTPLPFPEAVDLTAVTSPELRVAVVTAADGRVFRTENAGRTWSQQQ